jgi:hypothetical protein
MLYKGVHIYYVKNVQKYTYKAYNKNAQALITHAHSNLICNSNK